MNSDQALLRQYIEAGAEAAFAELVRRYAGLVYAAALRQLDGDAALAEDLAQSVFIDFARKAKTLGGHPSLAGWMHASVRLAALRLRRDRRHRQAREQEAAIMNESSDTPELRWELLAPVLDEAIASLAEIDRQALLLRFFQGWSHREVAAVLQLKEDAARMRVERALEKLRLYFARQGLKTSAALLATALPMHGLVAVPADLAARWTTAAMTGGGVGGAGAAGLGLKSYFTFQSAAVLVAAVLMAMLIYGQLPRETPPPSSSTTPPVLSPNPTMTKPPLINRGTLAAALLAAAQPAPAQNTDAPATVLPRAPRTLAAAPPPPAVAPAPIPRAPAAPVETAPLVPVAVPPELVKANNQFAFDFFRQASPRSNENAFFSPYSISTALAMTWAGARGDTAAQMAEALHFSVLPPGSAAAGFGLLQQALAQAETKTGSRLVIANSLWPEQNPEHPVVPAFLNLVQGDFGGEVVPVDFKRDTESARLQINAWVEEKTKSKIKDLLHAGDLDAGTRLALINAVYFKGVWAFPFRENATIQDQFHLADGSAKPIDLMHIFMPGFPAFSSYGDFPSAPVPFQMLTLNYFGDPEALPDPNAPPAGQRRGPGGPLTAGRGIAVAPVPRRDPGGALSFVVILPRSSDGLAELEKSLTADQVTAWFGQLVRVPVEVFLPKFHLEERYMLIENLRGLGITNAFLDPGPNGSNPRGADFSGINDAHDLFVTKVIHQTFLDVNEKGTEAAASTAVILGAGGRPAPPPVFRADHPFLFMIRENSTGTILFLGRLANPP